MNVSNDAGGRSVSYDENFQENYNTLLRWALQISSFDRSVSEDLLHDVYLRFNRRDETPDAVESVHGYMYTALKNSYVTHLRKNTRARSKQVAILDHDMIGHDNLVIDPRSVFKIHDELLAICEWACERKGKSIAASILILRFFHGYYSAEVARIVNRSRNAVEARLLKARREVNAYLAEHCVEKSNRQFKKADGSFGGRQGDLLIELRTRVFAAATGRCLPREDLKILYKKPQDGIEREELSHIVSCPRCLDRINELLKMPQLLERHPLDTLGPQTTVETLQCSRVLAMSAAM